MELTNTSFPTSRFAHPIIGISIHLQNTCAKEDQEIYKDQLTALNSSPLWINKKLYLTPFSELHKTPTLFQEMKGSLNLLITLFKNSVTIVLDNEYEHIRQSAFDSLDTILNTDNDTLTLLEWSSQFAFVYNQIDSYIKEQQKLYANTLTLYQQNPLFLCKPETIKTVFNKYPNPKLVFGCNRGDISLLNKYKILACIVWDKIYIFETFFKNYDIEKHISHILDNDIDNLFKCNDLDIISKKFYILYNKVISIATQCFSQLKNHSAFSDYDKKLPFKNFAQQFIEKTKQKALSFIEFGEYNDSFILLKNYFCFEDIFLNLDLAQTVFLCTNDYQAIKEALIGILRMNIQFLTKSIPLHKSDEKDYLYSSFENIYSTPFGNPVFDKKKISQIKNHINHYKAVKKWMSNNGYESCSPHLKVDCYTSLLGLINGYIDNFLLIMKQCNWDILKVDYKNLEDLCKKKIYFDNTGIEKEYLEPFNTLHNQYLQFIRLTLVNFLSDAPNLCTHQDIEDFIKKYEKQDTMLNRFRKYLLEKFIALYEATACLSKRQSDLRDCKIAGLERYFMKYIDNFETLEHRNNLIKKAINRAYEDYTMYEKLVDLSHEVPNFWLKGPHFLAKEDIIELYKKHIPELLQKLQKETTNRILSAQIRDTLAILTSNKPIPENIIFNTLETYKRIKNDNQMADPVAENKYAVKIYAKWAVAQNLLPNGWENTTLLHLHDTISQVLTHFFDNLAKEGEDLTEQKKRLQEALSLQELTVIYNEYLDIKTALDKKNKDEFIAWMKPDTTFISPLDWKNKTTHEMFTFFSNWLRAYMTRITQTPSFSILVQHGSIEKQASIRINNQLNNATSLKELRNIYDRIWEIDRKICDFEQAISQRRTERAIYAFRLLFCACIYCSVKFGINFLEKKSSIIEYIATHSVNGLLHGLLKMHSMVYS